MNQPKQPKHDSLASALAAAQSEMGNAHKNAKNPHFQSTYADLASLRDAVIPVLSSHGIALIQLCDGDGSSVSVTTRLLFGAEQMDCGRLTISIAGARNAAQAVGSAITYARRYQLGAVAEVSATEDDDGSSLDGTTASRGGDAQVKATLRHEVKCETKEDAEAAIRFATEGRMGLEDLPAHHDIVADRLARAREEGGGSWSGYLSSARQYWADGAGA